MTTAASATTPVLADYAGPATPGPVPLWRVLLRMPLVWVAVLVPGGFIFFLTLMTPSL